MTAQFEFIQHPLAVSAAREFKTSLQVQLALEAFLEGRKILYLDSEKTESFEQSGFMIGSERL